MMSTTDAPSLASTDGSAASSSFASNNQPSSATGGAGGIANANSSGPATTQHNASAPQNAQTATSYSSSLDSQIERLKRCEYLRENEVKALCLRAREILVDEGNVQRVDAPVTVSGCK